MHKRINVVSAMLLVAPVALVAACGSSDKPAPKTAAKARTTVAARPTTPPPSAAMTTDDRGDDPNRAEVSIDPEILKACGIAPEIAHFDFDSSSVKANDDRTLGAVASCFSTGALKGRTLKLVGRADPRGDAEYNVVLGQARADAVARYVQSKGLSAAQTATTSRGAMDATGNDAAGWSRDRRVDLVLGK